MGWISWAIVAVFVVIAALAVAAAVLRSEARQRTHYIAMVLVVSIVLGAAAVQFIAPGLQARYDVSTLDDSLSRNAAFAAIKKHDPQTYARIKGELREGLLAGKTRAELIERVRAEVSTLVQRRLPQASDEAATEYMRVMVQEMGELRQRGGDLCYRFLYAKDGQRVDLSQYVSANTLEADSAALGQIVRTSVVAPQPVPQQADVASSLQPVFEALAGRYGPDLALLKNPLAAGADADKLCSISIDMYTVILQRPTAESGKLIRYLMGQS